ncbi:hypothetical protein R5R35_011037 [Gryllus longicercus]
MAVHQLCKERVAIKILDKSKLDQKTRHMLTREILTMEAIHHPNIIRLYEVLETYSRIHLVLEYAGGGELFNKITSAGRFTESEARSIFSQITSAVKYMHGKKIIHRDIKAENVFFSTPTLVKLGDFGFSTELNSGYDQHLTTFCGSPPYAAPELFCDDSYLGAPVDIWALGVLLYFMVSGQMPFKAQTVASLKKYIIDGNYTMPSHLSEPCKILIGGILKRAPSDRLTMMDIQNSDWLKDCHFPSSPGPGEKYSLLPTVLLEEKLHTSKSENDLSDKTNNGPSALDIERKARNYLHELGITENMLVEHVERGAKSAVIGTYRIIVHRFQRQATVTCATMYDASRSCESADSSGTCQSASSSGYNFPLSLRRRSKSAAVKSNYMKGHKNRSRTCIIL